MIDGLDDQLLAVKTVPYARIVDTHKIEGHRAGQMLGAGGEIAEAFRTTVHNDRQDDVHPTQGVNEIGEGGLLDDKVMLGGVAEVGLQGAAEEIDGCQHARSVIPGGEVLALEIDIAERCTTNASGSQARGGDPQLGRQGEDVDALVVIIDTHQADGVGAARGLAFAQRHEDHRPGPAGKKAGRRG